MSELEDRLTSLLSDPDAMTQIMALARSLSGENDSVEQATKPTQTTENTGDLSALFSGDSCPTGEPAGTYEALRTEAFTVLDGTGDVRTFVSNFQNGMPLIPLYYSLDALAVSMDVTGNFGGSVSEFYAGIENWVFTDRKS